MTHDFMSCRQQIRKQLSFAPSTGKEHTETISDIVGLFSWVSKGSEGAIKPKLNYPRSTRE